METLLLCETGSRLYGLSHEGSDYDTYRVVSTLSGRRKNKTKHVIAGAKDEFTVDLKTFMYQAHMAHPQALEAMFSPITEEDSLTGYRKGFRVSLPTLHESYRERIIVESRNGVKQRRHALRWAINFREAVNNDGRFNPVLSAKDAEFVKEMANDAERYADAIRSVFPYEISLSDSRIQESFRVEQEASA
jgi:hypothetical protein